MLVAAASGPPLAWKQIYDSWFLGSGICKCREYFFQADSESCLHNFAWTAPFAHAGFWSQFLALQRAEPVLGEREWGWDWFLLEEGSAFFPALLLSRPVARISGALANKHQGGAIITKTINDTTGPTPFLKPSSRTEWSQAKRLKHFASHLTGTSRKLRKAVQLPYRLIWALHYRLIWAFDLNLPLLAFLCTSVTRTESFSARLSKGEARASQKSCNIFLAGNKFRSLHLFYFYFFYFFLKMLEGNVGLGMGWSRQENMAGFTALAIVPQGRN